MKRQLFNILFFQFFVGAINAQLPSEHLIRLNSLDSLNQKQGVWKEVRADSSWFVANYLNNTIHGDYFSFDANGNVTFFCHFINGKKHGVAQVFTDHITAVSYFEYGELKETYTYDLGRLITIQKYINGRIGEEVHIHKDGTRSSLIKSK
jgi:antitoxin component YwqK of YwqJK toxin-antitoxin module